jgi:hypothetical protein
MHLDLSDEQVELLLNQLDQLIDGDRFPLSPRVLVLREIRAMIKRYPVSEPPPRKVYAPPTKGGYRRRGLRSASARRPLPCVLNPRVGDRLPLQIGNRIGSAAGKWHNVIFPITGARAARAPSRWARMLALELACHGTRSVLAG